MLRTRKIYLERLDKFIESGFYGDSNLYSKLYSKRQTISSLWSVSIKDEKDPHKRPNPKGIILNPSTEWKPCNLGDKFGPSWTTHYFKLEIEIPKDFFNTTGDIYLLWDSDTEALLFTEKGVPLQGFTGGSGFDRRHEFLLAKQGSQQTHFTLFIEMACNGMFGLGQDGLINAPDPNRFFALKTCAIAVRDNQAFDLYMDFKIISEMAKVLPEDSNRGRQALFAANQMMDACSNIDDRNGWTKAQHIAKEFLKQKNGESQHTIFATGHTHIDVAWLWPYGETKRKAARSWTTQMHYMDLYKDYIFAQSQAQLYQWVKEDYPELFEKIKEKVKQGQFVPVGGTWVENDGILPTGEAMVRQFLHGQRFFKQEFGKYCDIFWLPDSFGFSGQLVQIMKKSHIKYFVTQKLSWNNINKYPSHTLIWEGIDGSEIITHFPPADTYCANLSVEQLAFNVQNFKDKERSNVSLSLFGHGDGGGGATIDHLERLVRCKDIDGLPKLVPAAPITVFEKIEKEHKEKGLLKWQGELYFELHRGTYTSQANIKKGNRKGEFLLRNVEIASVMAHLFKQHQYPVQELDRLWKLLLLNQFHDVLPGSSIALAYVDAQQYYDDIQKSGTQLLQNALKTITSNNEAAFAVLNTLSHKRRELIELKSLREEETLQKSHQGNSLVVVETDALGIFQVKSLECSDKVHAVQTDNEICLENSLIKVSFDKISGHFSLYDKRVKKVTISSGNSFLLFEDRPLFWDAWDIEIYNSLKSGSRRAIPYQPELSIAEQGPLRASIQLKLQLAPDCFISQIISLTSVSARIDFTTHIKWENIKHTCLKVAFQTTIRSPAANFEIQFGHLARPTHYNTSWDEAKFESHAQKYADLSEYGYGIALLNDCKYGYAIHEGEMALTLLRSPKAPDADCDMGEHEFKYAIFPHLNSLQDGDVIQEAYNFNCPLIVVPSADAIQSKSLLTVNKKQIIVEAIKLAEDGSKDIIVRLYEAFGGTATDVELEFDLNKAISKIVSVNLLEEQDDSIHNPNITLQEGKKVTLDFVKPFEVVTLRITL